VQAAFQELQDRGFIVPRAKGSFDWKQRQATEWEITTELCDEQLAKRLYREWLKKQNTAPTVGTVATMKGRFNVFTAPTVGTVKPGFGLSRHPRWVHL
jgi:hypothetical protein